jgi:hypothetical protein
MLRGSRVPEGAIKGKVTAQPADIDTMAEAKPRSSAIYRRGPAWIQGRELRNQPTLLDHGRFLAKLEQARSAVHAGPMYRLDEGPRR